MVDFKIDRRNRMSWLFKRRIHRLMIMMVAALSFGPILDCSHSQAQAMEKANIKICSRCEALPCICQNPYQGDWSFINCGRFNVESTLASGKRNVQITNDNWGKGYSYLYKRLSGNHVEMTVKLNLDTVANGRVGVLAATGQKLDERVFRFYIEKSADLADYYSIGLECPQHYRFPLCGAYTRQARRIPVQSDLTLKVVRYGNLWEMHCGGVVLTLADYALLADANSMLWGVETSTDGGSLNFPRVNINAVVRPDYKVSDSDGDGLTNQLEELAGTDKNSADSDGDSSNDFKEIVELGMSGLSIGDEKPPAQAVIEAKNDSVYVYKAYAVKINVLENDRCRSREEVERETRRDRLNELMGWLKDNYQLAILLEFMDRYGIDEHHSTPSDTYGSEVYQALKLMLKYLRGNYTVMAEALSLKLTRQEAYHFNKYATVEHAKGESMKGGPVLKITWVSPPKKGFAYVEDNQVVYVPYEGETGEDGFSYGVEVCRAGAWFDTGENEWLSGGDRVIGKADVKVSIHDKLFFINNQGRQFTSSGQKGLELLNYQPGRSHHSYCKNDDLVFSPSASKGCQWVVTAAYDGGFYIDNYIYDVRLTRGSNGKMSYTTRNNNDKRCVWRSNKSGLAEPWFFLISHATDRLMFSGKRPNRIYEDRRKEITAAAISDSSFLEKVNAHWYWCFSEALVVNDDYFSATQGAVTSLDVLANDISTSGNIIISSVTQPASGEVRITGNSLVYIADKDGLGDYTFSYTALQNGTEYTASVKVKVEKNTKWHVTHDGSFGKALYPAGETVRLSLSGNNDNYRWNVIEVEPNTFYIEDEYGRRLQALNGDLAMSLGGVEDDSVKWLYSSDRFLINRANGLKLYASLVGSTWELGFVDTYFMRENARWGLVNSPLDYDNDGLVDQYELGHGLDPVDADMDDDGKLDGQEVSLGTDPKVYNRYSGGDGSVGRPFKISTPGDFYNMISASTDDYFSLVADIDMSKLRMEHLQLYEFADRTFSGTLNGYGHSVSNLQAGNAGCVSVFGYLKNATIADCKFYNFDRALGKGDSSYSLFKDLQFFYDKEMDRVPDSCIGDAADTLIRNCNVVSLRVRTALNGRYSDVAPPLLGTVRHSDIVNCHSDADSSYGGVIAQVSTSSTFSSCSSSGDVLRMKPYEDYAEVDTPFSQSFTSHIKSQKRLLKNRFNLMMSSWVGEWLAKMKALEESKQSFIALYTGSPGGDYRPANHHFDSAMAAAKKVFDTGVIELDKQYAALTKKLNNALTESGYYENRLPQVSAFKGAGVKYARLFESGHSGFFEKSPITGKKRFVVTDVFYGLAGQNFIKYPRLELNYDSHFDTLPVGGLVREAHDTAFDGCHSTGNISGFWKVGGLVGTAEGGSFKNCFTTGNVSSRYIEFSGPCDIATAHYIGGLVGKCSANIEDCYSRGNVQGHQYVGGLVGYCETVSDAAASADRVYAGGEVTGDAYVGGLIGCVSTLKGHTVTMTDAYALNAKLEAKSGFYNRLVGGEAGSGLVLVNCYALAEMQSGAGINQSSPYYGVDISRQDAVGQAAYDTDKTDWDFVNIWSMPKGTPDFPVLVKTCERDVVAAEDDAFWMVSGTTALIPVLDGGAAYQEVRKDRGRGIVVESISDLSDRQFTDHITISADKRAIHFTALQGYKTTVSLTYKIRSAEGGYDTAVLSVHIVAPKVPRDGLTLDPVNVVTEKNVPVNFSISEDLYSIGFEFGAVNTIQGTVKGRYPDFTYTPAKGFTGTECFTYRKQHEHGFTSFETITIVVTDGDVDTPAPVDLELYNNLEN